VRDATGCPMYEELLPWPKASGLSNPTTVGERVCMGSGCVCARVLDARSCRVDGRRAAGV
jgi:hypothetical protein